jgi:hypothetical protein
MSFETSEILSAVGLLFVSIGGAWTVARAVSTNSKARTAVMWKKIDELKKDVADIKTEQAVLKHAVSTLPTRDALSMELRESEKRIEHKLEIVSENFNQIVMLNFKAQK